jgi:hypothetical protein
LENLPENGWNWKWKGGVEIGSPKANSSVL